jgi:hypothetical protein
MNVVEDHFEPDPRIEAAICEGARAGVFRRAERLNPQSASVWGGLAERHTKNAGDILAAVTGALK